MCFYDQFQMQCGDHKWGHFRQHCSKEYRTGETCGMKLAMATYLKAEKCKLCGKIDTKNNKLNKEWNNIQRWQKEQQLGTRREASIDAAYHNIQNLQYEIDQLNHERLLAQRTL